MAITDAHFRDIFSGYRYDAVGNEGIAPYQRTGNEYQGKITIAAGIPTMAEVTGNTTSECRLYPARSLYLKVITAESGKKIDSGSTITYYDQNGAEQTATLSADLNLATAGNTTFFTLTASKYVVSIKNDVSGLAHNSTTSLTKLYTL